MKALPKQTAPLHAYAAVSAAVFLAKSSARHGRPPKSDHNDDPGLNSLSSVFSRSKLPLADSAHSWRSE